MPNNEENDSMSQANYNSIAVGGINIGGDVSGDITIGNTGYTADQVSSLLSKLPPPKAVALG